MSRLLFSISKIVSQREEELAESIFTDAYAELRRACPSGNIHIRLSVEGPLSNRPKADKA